jgi:hypothetical protein
MGEHAHGFVVFELWRYFEGMSAPIPNDPPISVQDANIADAGFAPGPPVASLCGFAIPGIPKFSYGFNLPSFGLPSPFPPIPTLALSINCSLDNPLDVAKGIPSGGGRKPNLPPDQDKEFLSGIGV